MKLKQQPKSELLCSNAREYSSHKAYTEIQLLKQNLKTCTICKTRIYSGIRCMSSKCQKITANVSCACSEKQVYFLLVWCMSQVHSIYRTWKSLHRRIPEARIFSCMAYDFKLVNCKSPVLHLRVCSCKWYLDLLGL